MKRLILLVISVVSLSAMAQQTKTIQWHIEDMHCGNCARRISTALEHLTGVDSLDFNLDKHTFTVKYDANKTNRDNIRQAINSLGYTPVTYYDQDIVAYLYFILPEGSISNSIIGKAMEIEGVADANISTKNHSLAISYDTTEITDDKLVEELKSRDIKVEIPKPHECQEK